MQTIRMWVEWREVLIVSIIVCFDFIRLSRACDSVLATRLLRTGPSTSQADKA